MTDVLPSRAGQVLDMLEQATGKSLRAMIEISDRCNEVCVHCYQEQGRKGEMTTDQIKAVMDELAEMGVLVLAISGGEATLRHDFIELLEHARKRSFAIRLFTNGLTMTRQLAAELHRLAVHVVEISLYSHRAEVHDFITGVPRSFERTTNGIRYLAELGVDVHVKAPMMQVNETELDELRAFALSLGALSVGIDPNVLMPRENIDRGPERLSRSQAEYERAVHEVDRTRLPPGPIPRKTWDKHICGAGETVHIEPNGELRPCTMLELKIGDAREGVAAARATDAAFEGLRAITWQDVHGCRKCELAGACGRCFASALAEVGDALAPYPSACATARSRYRVYTGAPIEVAPGVDGRTDVGPYRHIEGHRFEAIADEVTAQDDLLASRLGWIRRAALPAPGPALRPGELVQLRRPGNKRAREAQVPALARKAPLSHPASAVSSSILSVAVDSAR